MRIAMIHSRETPEGFFEQPVDIPDVQLNLSVAPLDLIQYTIQAHLAVCVQTTKIPLNVGIWMVEFNPEICKRFNLPEGFTV